MKEKYRIKGKVYYKVAEEVVSEEDKCIVSEIWSMTNPSGEEFRLLIRRGKSTQYALYAKGGGLIHRTNSISQVKTRNKDA